MPNARADSTVAIPWAVIRVTINARKSVVLTRPRRTFVTPAKSSSLSAAIASGVAMNAAVNAACHFRQSASLIPPTLLWTY